MSKPDKSWAIALLIRQLLTDPSPEVRQVAVKGLAKLGRNDQRAIITLAQTALKDQDVIVRTLATQAIISIYTPKDSPKTMSDKPKIEMNFNAPVTGVAGNVEGDFIVNASDPAAATALDELKTMIVDLQQQHPDATEREAIAIIDAEFQAIQQKQPWRWQNLLNLKRLWKGGKQAAINLGEHFVEESPWGKAAIGFLEGVTEDPE